MVTNLNHMTTWRVFVAIPLPDGVKQSISAAMQLYVKKVGTPFRRVTYDQDYHITLQFMGDVEQSLVPDISAKMNEAVSGLNPFSLQLAEWDTFGRSDAPRVLWIGVQDESEALNQLQARVVSSMRDLAFVPESRPYKAHITTARQYNYDLNQGFELTRAHLGQAHAQWIVDRIVLYRTRLGEQPMYEVIAEQLF